MAGEKSSARRGVCAPLWGAVALLCVLGGRFSFADDAKPVPPAPESALEGQTAKIYELEGAVAKHAVLKDDERLVVDAETAQALATEVSDPKLKIRLVELLGVILAATRAEAVQRPAILALGVVADPAGFRYLRPFMTSLTWQALDAAREMRADESVPVLMDLVRNSKDLGIAAKAMGALGTFGRNKATRERILMDLFRIVEVDRRSLGRQVWTGGRYDALSGQLAATLSELTGQAVESSEDWLDLLEKYKDDLSHLFRRQDSIQSPSKEEAARRALEEPSAVSALKVLVLEATVTAHLATRDPVALTEDLGTVATLSKSIWEPNLRSRLVGVVGRILEGTRDEAVQREAVRTLGTMAEPAGFRFLLPFLRLPSVTGRPLIMEAVDSASKMKSDESVPFLLALVDDHGETRVAAAALKAFSTFGGNRATRETILSRVTATVKKGQNEPRVSRPPPCARWSGGEYSRYQVLSAVLTDTLNAMTGRDEIGPDAWFELVEKNRENLSALFGP